MKQSEKVRERVVMKEEIKDREDERKIVEWR